ncbi:hypothetical protein HY634_04500 [Candidatus Uhrbacteria bacterium]|nr:hypothetical protein [Candidatus Uhrbacteria bacterium]
MKNARTKPDNAPDPVLVSNLARRCNSLMGAAHEVDNRLFRGRPSLHAHLALAQFERLYQLVQRRPEELRTIRGCGGKAIAVIKQMLTSMGLSLGMTLDERTLLAVCQKVLRERPGDGSAPPT